MTDKRGNIDITKKFYEALTDLIYDYYCAHREDKTTLPDPKVVDITRKSTMDGLKWFMDTALEVHGQKLFSIKCGSKDKE